MASPNCSAVQPVATTQEDVRSVEILLIVKKKRFERPGERKEGLRDEVVLRLNNKFTNNSRDARPAHERQGEPNFSFLLAICKQPSEELTTSFALYSIRSKASRSDSSL